MELGGFTLEKQFNELEEIVAGAPGASAEIKALSKDPAFKSQFLCNPPSQTWRPPDVPHHFRRAQNNVSCHTSVVANRIQENPVYPMLSQGKRIQDPAAVVMVDRDGEKAFQVTPLGQAAHAQGVLAKTCATLHRWLGEIDPQAAWDPLDILALVLGTPDGVLVQPLRIRNSHLQQVQSEFNQYLIHTSSRLGEEWMERSPLMAANLKDTRWMATLLAIRQWMRGTPIYVEPGSEGSNPGSAIPVGSIEETCGLYSYGSSLYHKARELARLVRVLAAAAQCLPAGLFPPSRPGELPDYEEGFLSVPHDLEALAEELLWGMPHLLTPLAQLQVQGLSRAETMGIYHYLQIHALSPDLPLLERVQLLCEGESFPQQLLAPGIRDRLKEALQESRRGAVAENLNGDPTLVSRFYSHEVVIQAQVVQGQDRNTALRILQGSRTALRRSSVGSRPIRITQESDVASWRNRGAVEFLLEVGKSTAEGYWMDHFLVDLEGRNGYPLEKLKTLVREIARRFREHPWIENRLPEVHWSGEKGFQILATFPGSSCRRVEQVKRELETLLARLCNHTDIFLREQPTLMEPYVILDLSAVAPRGLIRNVFSLHAASGSVCVPVDFSYLGAFNPPEEAAPDAVLKVLDRVIKYARSAAPYEELIRIYFQCVKDIYPA